MNAAIQSASDAWWKAYLKASALMLPGLVIWELVRTKCVPVLLEMCQRAGLHTGQAPLVWDFSMLIVRFGFYVLLLAVVGFVLLELLSPAWRRNRRSAVTGFAWLVNVAVIVGLAALFTSAMVSVPQLLR
jgi:hypothetical protein